MTSVEAAIEADSIEMWFHCSDPLGNAAVYGTLTGGLLAAKAGYRDARARHDHDAAARWLLEVVDLTALAAAAADGLAAQRARFLASGDLWPLAAQSRDW